MYEKKLENHLTEEFRKNMLTLQRIRYVINQELKLAPPWYAFNTKKAA